VSEGISRRAVGADCKGRKSEFRQKGPRVGVRITDGFRTRGWVSKNCPWERKKISKNRVFVKGQLKFCQIVSGGENPKQSRGGVVKTQRCQRGARAKYLGKKKKTRKRECYIREQVAWG